jgi:hypothetical protein
MITIITITTITTITTIIITAMILMVMIMILRRRRRIRRSSSETCLGQLPLQLRGRVVRKTVAYMQACSRNHNLGVALRELGLGLRVRVRVRVSTFSSNFISSFTFFLSYRS